MHQYLAGNFLFSNPDARNEQPSISISKRIIRYGNDTLSSLSRVPNGGISNILKTTSTNPPFHNERGTTVDLVVFTATFYKSASDTRCQMCLRTIELLKSKAIPIVIVDDSPDATIRDLMRSKGANVVQKQQTKEKKGAALREAASLAATIDGVNEDTWLCWQEPEKFDLANHWVDAISDEGSKKADVLIPTRNDEIFKKTYPIEQYHSENFANMYLNAVANDYCSKNQITFPTNLDWHFGPVAFRRRHLNLWVKYDGVTYEAQFNPVVYAARTGLVVYSTEVPFHAPLEMKQEEEGDVAFIEKRLAQINDLDPKVKAAWTDDLPDLS